MNSSPAPSMTPLRILAIIEAHSITGPAKNLLEFARRAASEQISTTIATFTRNNTENQFTKTVREAGIALETIPERGPFDPATLRSLRALIARVRPDIIQTHAVKSHFLARSAALHQTAPWVAFHHGYTWPTFKARAYNQLDRWSLRSARQILTVSRPFRDELVAFGVRPDRIEIVHNAIPADWGSNALPPDTASIAPGKKVVLIVGRLSREKDHLTLLEAIHRLPPAIRPHLVMVGDGPERPRIEQKIARLEMRDSVTLTGHQASAEPWYRIADIAVLSSLSEGSPNALLEAMATSVPVVATGVGGIPEIVTHEESALLVAPSDAPSMTAALERLLTNPELADRLKTRASQLILERHQPDARMRKLAAIYRQLP